MFCILLFFAIPLHFAFNYDVYLHIPFAGLALILIFDIFINMKH